MPTDNHDLGRDSVGGQASRSDTQTGGPGYEISDVNVNGVIVFLSGLLGFVFIFFIFCFFMGRVINVSFLKQDGPATKWQRQSGALPPSGKRENLTSNPEMDQKDLQRMTTIFPTPRLDVDDGNQATADMHAREDLLLNHYSMVDGQPGTIRIPIERAMALVVERQLPVAASGTSTGQLAGDEQVTVQTPLTTGFARTSYELDTMEARAQKMNYTKAAAEDRTGPNAHKQ